MGAQINIEHLSKSYGSVTVFKSLSFMVKKGESLILVGPSGCGKSTLLHIMAGLYHDFTGTYQIDPPKAKLSLVMQTYGLFPWKNAWKNLELPLSLAKISIAEKKNRINAMLGELGLSELSTRYPAQMSGGQKQRLALGRALINQPDLILLDEPFSSLDAITRENQANFLAKLWQKYQPTMIMATHSIEEAVFLGNRILVLGHNPTTIVAEINNPNPGQPTARLDQKFFNLVRTIRQYLAETA